MQTLAAVGQIVLSLYFLYNGANHFLNFKGLTAYAAAKEVPFPGAAVAVSGLMLLAGGLSLLLEYQVAAGSVILALFLVPTSFLMHNFWAVEDEAARAGELAHFLKNIALAAAVLQLPSVLG
ncbi:MAG: hypothetical protein BAA04_12245 [Firmicutes bacterium ZCTH02-B6]|nr:MAG: hypothetical protein BAA04_12245 [Firmicutes bacterium ZCTH02-B6]